MRRTIAALSAAIAGVALAHAAPARAATLPAWVKPAVTYLDDRGYLDRDSLRPNQPMSRARFGRVMRRSFGGGYDRTRGSVTAREVGTALVRALGHARVAAALNDERSPDGWRPGVTRWFGSEVVARELGLRHDRPVAEDRAEASAAEPMSQADVAWAVWRAKTAPQTYAADALMRFELASYGDVRREIVRYALGLVGTPYVWGGEWPTATPAGYPYGGQIHGGFDCSGFAWYVLRARTTSWAPVDRPYAGWSLPERTSSDMAAAARNRLSYRELRPGDLVFFAPGGRDARAADVYHVGIYLGKGWMVHSSGSRAGISLGEIAPGAWWHGQFAWGRRVVR